MAAQSDSSNSPYIIMLNTAEAPYQIPLSIYGRPTNVKCEFARFPDQGSTLHEIQRIKEAIRDHKDSIPNRSYNMSDVARAFKMYTPRVFAIK